MRPPPRVLPLVSRVMCTLVYAVLPPNLAQPPLVEQGRRCGLHLDHANDRKIEQALHHDERLYSTFTYCSCGTALGRVEQPVRVAFTERDLADLRRRGWGAAKIERWKTQRLEARPPPPTDDRPSGEAIQFAEFLATVLGRGAARAGLVVHTAGATVERGESFPRRRLDAATVHGLRINVVYDFRST